MLVSFIISIFLSSLLSLLFGFMYVKGQKDEKRPTLVGATSAVMATRHGTPEENSLQNKTPGGHPPQSSECLHSSIRSILSPIYPRQR
jgi:hypothetical protein